MRMTFSPGLGMLGNILMYGVAFGVMILCSWGVMWLGYEYQKKSVFVTETFETNGLKVILIKYKLGHGKNKHEGIRVLELGTGARGNFLEDHAPTPEQAHLTALMLQAASQVQVEEARGKAGVRVI